MLVISHWLLIRFLRLRLYVLVFFLPLCLFLWARFASEGDPAFAYALLIGLFLYLFPVVAVVFVLSAVDRAQWDLFLSRPLHPAGLLTGTWLGSVASFWACQLALVVVAVAVGMLADSPEDPALAGRIYADEVAVYRGVPGQVQPRPENDSAAARDWLESVPWTFEVGGLLGENIRRDADVEAFLVAEVGRFVGGDAIYRARKVRAEVVFHSLDAGDPRRRRDVELENGTPVKLSIPANAIRDDGSLVLSVARVEEAEENDRDDGVLLKHDHKEHNHEKHAKEEPDQEKLNEEVGKEFFWFESRRDRNGKPESGLLVVRDRIGFISNFVRTSLQAAALIPLLVALTTLAAALFSRPVAFAFVLTLFICGSSMAFLIDVVDSLQLRSASLVFGGVAKPPTALDWALKHFLEFWILVLPDFDRMRGAAWLFSGDAIRWVTILHAQGLAALYTVVSLLPTSVFLRRWEVMR